MFSHIKSKNLRNLSFLFGAAEVERPLKPHRRATNERTSIMQHGQTVQLIVNIQTAHNLPMREGKHGENEVSCSKRQTGRWHRTESTIFKCAIW